MLSVALGLGRVPVRKTSLGRLSVQVTSLMTSHHHGEEEEERRGLRDMLIYSTVVDVQKYKKEKKRLDYSRSQERIPILHPGMAVAKMKKHNDLMSGPSVPVALQFINRDPLPEVQCEPLEPDREITIEDAKIGSSKPVYPFAIYDKVYSKDEASKVIDESIDESSGEEPERRGRVVRRRRTRGQPKSQNDQTSSTKIDYEVITDNLEEEEVKEKLDRDELFRYGSADPSVAGSDRPCSGCGAHLHCQDPKLPGFVPVEVFSDDENRRCQRCYVMEKYDVALKVSVSPEDYPRTVSHLYRRKALIILVVDLLDFPGSVWPGVIDLLGVDKHFVLVGNKVDLLPQDSDKYLKQIEDSMRQSFRKKCLAYGVKPPKQISSCLISARTGFNVEHLIDKLYRYWSYENQYKGSYCDAYIVGTTNVGKSSLFNTLLDSDLCSLIAVNRVDKAMTSPVPGTTLNLLKFPLARPEPSRLSNRKLRLERDREVWSTENRLRIEELRRTQKRELSLISQPVRRTIEVVASMLPASKKNEVNYTFNYDPNVQREDEKTVPVDPKDPYFRFMKWCYDTPGTVSVDQIINLLTQPEIALTLQSELPLKPRTYVLSEGQTLFIAGIGRFDIVKAPSQKFRSMDVTVFTSDRLPINIVRTEDAEEFYEKAMASNLLKVPSCTDYESVERLRDFPALQAQDFHVDGISMWESACDIVLSSAGWVSCNPGIAQVFEVRAWTPGGKGIFMRDLAYLPRAVLLKGKKIKKTPTYENNRIFGAKDKHKAIDVD